MTATAVHPTYPSHITPPPTPSGRRRWTCRDFEFLEKAGILEGRYELLDGEIISKMGQGSPHNITITFVMAYLITAYGKLVVRSQTTAE